MNPPTSFKRLLLAGVCVTSVLVASAWSAPSQVTAQLDRRSLPLGESAQLAVTVKDSQPVELSVPPVDGLEITPVGQQSSVQFINGAPSAEVTYLYQVTPNRSGNFTIPAIAVPGGNSTQPIAFRVEKALSRQNSQSSRQSGSPPSATGQEEQDAAPPDSKADSAFLRVVLPKQEITVGELVPVEIKACFPAGMSVSLNGLPMLSGGAFSLNKLNDNPEQTREAINGQPYNVITWSSALSGVKAGEYPLNLELPVLMRVREKSKAGGGRNPFKDFFGDNSPFDDSIADDFFDQVTEKPLALHTDGAPVRIQPLPEQGRPPDFSGAVGNFDVSAEASAIRAATGDPITLKMKITGQGNFDRVATSGLATGAGWKSYKPNARFEPADRQGFTGTKTFEQQIVATQAGSSEIPAVSFSYFDPETHRYVTKTTSPIPVEIVPGSPVASPLLPAITPAPVRPAEGLDRPETGGVSSLSPVVLAPWFLISNSLMATATVIGLVGVRWRQRRANDPARVRAAAASAAVRRAVSAMDEAIRDGNSAGFFHAARQAVAERLAERWSVPASQVTPAEIKARLNGSGENICALFNRGDEVAYSHEEITASELTQWRAKIAQQLAHL